MKKLEMDPHEEDDRQTDRIRIPHPEKISLEKKWIRIEVDIL